MNDLILAEKIAQWQRLKALVLDSVSSPITKRVYSMALDEFLDWFRQEPRPGGFCKATVSTWRASLETRGLGSSSIIIRMSAIRKLAGEAADNGLIAPELAAGISRVKSVKSTGIRVGNWLSLRQAQALLSAPDTTTLKGLRDRAILAVLLGCGLRRSEVAALAFTHIQQRDGRWCTVPQKFIEPPKEVQKQIEEEVAIKQRVFESPQPDRLWRGPFVAPAKTAYTSSFGVRRTYNGKTLSVHQGLDYKAAFGTQVTASNSGRVAIARDMYFEGGFIVIDHGESIFTLYMHLSEFLVREGANVQKGDDIARSGSSGRVTGPHLHFAVRWEGAYLEPSTLLALWRE